MPNPLKRSLFRIFGLTGLGITVVYGLLLGVVMMVLRSELRQQMIDRDAEILTAVAQSFWNTSGELPDREERLLKIAVAASELIGVIAVSIHDLQGNQVISIPADLEDSAYSQSLDFAMFEGGTMARFHPDIDIHVLFGETGMPPDTQPFLEVNIPLVDEIDLPAAHFRYWLEGSSIAAEFRDLDRRLILMAAIALLGFAALLCAVFVFSGSHLYRLTTALRRANAELSLSAKASAIGSISAHLIHGLKNVCAILQHQIRYDATRDELRQTTNRIQQLIDDTVSALRNQQDLPDQISFTVSEIVDIAIDRHQPIALRHQIKLQKTGDASCKVSAKNTQLILLILSNLIHNALEVSPEGSTVTIRVSTAGPLNCIEVSDNGPGVPQSLRERIFEPGVSSRENGSGLGLAISVQMARSMDADLTLSRSDSDGSSFALKWIPDSDTL